MEKISTNHINIYSKWGIDTVDLAELELEEQMTNYIPEAVARKYQLVPLSQQGEVLSIAMNNPLDLVAIEDIRLMSERTIRVFKAEEAAINYTIEKLYGASNANKIKESVEQAYRRKNNNYYEKRESIRPDLIQENAPIIKLVNNLFERAIHLRASDIHIEQQESRLKIRARVDGLLQNIMVLPSEVATNIIARIKILASLDISERRMPQDGRMTYVLDDRKIDIRISTLPTYFGEKLVVRLIYPIESQYCLEGLGFRLEDYKKIECLLKEPNGIILVTGPTGSGKTTTLAAMLKKLNNKEKNIVTVEDPVENLIENINQTAVNNKVGYTFAVALRAILRQDPDIIMIGEIRDSETSQMAVRAAITGHLVLSTLHTNDSATALTRLIDMGVPSFMVKASVKGVVSQRLIRRICPHCKEVLEVSSEERKLYQLLEDTVIYKGRGCNFCNRTGYMGRIGLYEVLIPGNEGGINTSNSIWKNAHEHMIKGLTTPDEFLKVISEI